MGDLRYQGLVQHSLQDCPWRHHELAEEAERRQDFKSW